MLTHIPAQKQKLFEGGEPELWTTRLPLPVGGISVTLAEINKNHLDTLSSVIGDAAFDQVVTDGELVRTPIGTYEDRDGSSLVYLLHDDCLYVLGVQETSPARFELTFQGAWKIS